MTNRQVVQALQWALMALILLLGLAGSLFAQAQNLPPKPDRYIIDEAGVLDDATLSTINAQLDQCERDTSNQIVVAIYPNLPANAELAQYTTDTFNAWGVGQKGKDNGVILLVFVKDHQMFICTGRGLEGALPNAACKNIITQVIAPQFKQGNYAEGVQAGVNAIVAATKDEYKGNGSTVAQAEIKKLNNAQPQAGIPTEPSLATGCAACSGFAGLIIFVIVAIIALNIALLVWVARDAKSRGMDSSVLWMLLVMFTGLLGLVIYLFTRPQGNLIPCPSCNNKRLQVSAKCPHCGNA